MSPRDYEFRPPEPRFPKDSETKPAAEDAAARRRPRGLVIGSVLSGFVVIALVVALVMLWGNSTEPVALDPDNDAAETTEPTESAPEETDLIGPDATNPPHTVAPGDVVPIDVDAYFPEDVTLVPPELGDWSEQQIINRPDQFTAVSPDYSATIEVWQTSVFNTPQSDEALTHAQLNRVSDECSSGSNVTQQGEPVVDTLTGTDDTKLEVLVSKVTGCNGGELWLIERVMPLTQVRFHIVLWDAYSVADNEELIAMYEQVAFEF
ncbi:MAG: hypothetical protein ACTHXA_06000 [Gulosibacter sp.]|uniref:hypothetical protein n=1 Tax=Gulosibacter sp. TaxID=2817531 RepID=UPI003F90DBED